MLCIDVLQWAVAPAAFVKTRAATRVRRGIRAGDRLL